MSSVWSFAFLWCFESLAAGAPTEEGKKEQGMQLCQPTEPNASWILSILYHFHASLTILPRANESHIMSEDRCQKSLSLLGSNDLKCRREFSHLMPKQHRHRMSKKWSIITAVIKFELMTKRRNWPLPSPPAQKYFPVILHWAQKIFKLSDVRGKETYIRARIMPLGCRCRT